MVYTKIFQRRTNPRHTESWEIYFRPKPIIDLRLSTYLIFYFTVKYIISKIHIESFKYMNKQMPVSIRI